VREHEATLNLAPAGSRTPMSQRALSTQHGERALTKRRFVDQGSRGAAARMARNAAKLGADSKAYSARSKRAVSGCSRRSRTWIARSKSSRYCGTAAGPDPHGLGHRPALAIRGTVRASWPLSTRCAKLTRRPKSALA
jgi:hypothetical protein